MLGNTRGYNERSTELKDPPVSTTLLTTPEF